MNPAMIETFKRHPLPWKLKPYNNTNYYKYVDCNDEDIMPVYGTNKADIELAETVVRCVNAKKELLPT